MYYKFYKEHECEFEIMVLNLSGKDSDILIESIQTCFFINLNF